MTDGGAKKTFAPCDGGPSQFFSPSTEEWLQSRRDLMRIRRFNAGTAVWTVSARIGVVHPPSESDKGQRPGSYQTGAKPQLEVSKATPSANGAVQFPKSLSAECSVHILPANRSPIIQSQPMERAFSAPHCSSRIPSPPGWAGMNGAFGAPRCAGAAASGRSTKPEMSNLPSGFWPWRSILRTPA